MYFIKVFVTVLSLQKEFESFEVSSVKNGHIFRKNRQSKQVTSITAWIPGKGWVFVCLFKETTK